MTWTKLGDEFADECWTLSSDAFRLHTEGLVWSNRKATDGQLAKDDMRRWAKRPEAAEELVSIGWWEDRGEHYQIVHHLGYQRTKEEIAHQSNVNAENAKKRWAAKKAAAAKKAERRLRLLLRTNRNANRITNRNAKGPGQNRTGFQEKGVRNSAKRKTAKQTTPSRSPRPLNSWPASTPTCAGDTRHEPLHRRVGQLRPESVPVPSRLQMQLLQEMA